MIIEHLHLTTTNTCTHVTHTVVVTDFRMLIIRVRIARLSSVPHNIVCILLVTANQRTTTRSRNHLVAVERQHTKTTERTQHLTIEARTQPFGGILNHRNTILVCYRHNSLTVVRHTIECHRNYCLRILTYSRLALNDSFFQQLRIHIPSFSLRVDEHWLCTKISNRMRRSTEGERLHAHLIPRLYATCNQC